MPLTSVKPDPLPPTTPPHPRTTAKSTAEKKQARAKILPSTSSGASDTDSTDGHSDRVAASRKKKTAGSRKMKGRSASVGSGPYATGPGDYAAAALPAFASATGASSAGAGARKQGAFKASGLRKAGALTKASKAAMKKSAKQRAKSAPTRSAGAGAGLDDEGVFGAEPDPWMIAGNTGGLYEWMGEDVFDGSSDSDASEGSAHHQRALAHAEKHQQRQQQHQHQQLLQAHVHHHPHPHPHNLSSTMSMDVWGTDLLEFNTSAIDTMDALAFGGIKEELDTLPDACAMQYSNESWQPTAHIPRLVSPSPSDFIFVS